jgi:hypothetical protein
MPLITLFPCHCPYNSHGGFGPGVLAIALSALAAWQLFLPAGEIGEREVLIAVFVFASAINLIVSPCSTRRSTTC